MRGGRYKWDPDPADRLAEPQAEPRDRMLAQADRGPQAAGELGAMHGLSCKSKLTPGHPVGLHDEVVSLLHGAAEIEHSLLVQYLYAAYSLETDPARLTGAVPRNASDLVRMWRDSIVTVAVQEMGHLLSIQNLLRFVGGPLNFEREDFPFKSDLYPFRFALRPLSRTSLARYIAAEMPHDPSRETFPEDLERDIASRLPEKDCVNRVGALYARLSERLAALPDRVFRPDSIRYQARARDWGADKELLVHEVTSKERALAALVDIGRQGEGFEGDADETHFHRFLEIYKHPAFPDDEKGPNWNPVRPVPTNPRTQPSSPSALPADEDDTTTVITNPEALAWAHLFNLRYRMLLYQIDHSLRVGRVSVPTDDGPLPLRHVLISWSRRQMTAGLREIAMMLVRLPADGSGALAAPPFELPDSLSVPDLARDRWLPHLDMIETSQAVMKDLRTPSSEQVLNRLRKLDDDMKQFIDEHRLDSVSEGGKGKGRR